MEHQIIFDSAGHSVIGLFYEPDEQPDKGVVFCNPFFEERKSAHRALVEWARTLAEQKVAVLRFDYRGCGDSAGDFGEFSFAEWVADTKQAVSELVKRTGLNEITLFGLRLGGAVAFAAGAKDQKVRNLVLWEPVVNGEEYLRQELRKKLMKEMMTFGGSQRTRDELFSELEAGRNVDFDGYLLTPKLYRDLIALDLTESGIPEFNAVQVMNIGAGGRPSEKQNVFNKAVAETVPAHDVRAVRHQPFWNLIGYVDTGQLMQETLPWITGNNPEDAGEENPENT